MVTTLYTLLRAGSTACGFCSLGQVFYPINTFLFSSIATVIVSILPSIALEQSTDLFSFLPKLGMADPWTAIPEVIQSFFDFPRREAGGEISQA